MLRGLYFCCRSLLPFWICRSLPIESIRLSVASLADCRACTGPPGQVAAIAGKKEGFKQGAVSGVLKELGYTEDQVRVLILVNSKRDL